MFYIVYDVLDQKLYQFNKSALVIRLVIKQEQYIQDVILLVSMTVRDRTDTASTGAVH